jgi:hypothetical protein
MPKAQGPGGQEFGSAKWTVNGKIVITAEAHQEPQRTSVSTAA